MEPEPQKIGQDTPARTGTVGQPTVQEQEYEEKDLTEKKDRMERGSSGREGSHRRK